MRESIIEFLQIVERTQDNDVLDTSSTLPENYHEFMMVEPELCQMALFAELNPAPVFPY